MYCTAFLTEKSFSGDSQQNVRKDTVELATRGRIKMRNMFADDKRYTYIPMMSSTPRDSPLKSYVFHSQSTVHTALTSGFPLRHERLTACMAENHGKKAVLPCC